MIGLCRAALETARNVQQGVQKIRGKAPLAKRTTRGFVI